MYTYIIILTNYSQDVVYTLGVEMLSYLIVMQGIINSLPCVKGFKCVGVYMGFVNSFVYFLPLLPLRFRNTLLFLYYILYNIKLSDFILFIFNQGVNYRGVWGGVIPLINT